VDEMEEVEGEGGNVVFRYGHVEAVGSSCLRHAPRGTDIVLSETSIKEKGKER